MNGDDASCLQYDKDHNVKYPSISGPAGGADLRVTYGGGSVFGVPAVCLIRPDRYIIEKDLADEAAMYNPPYVDSLSIVLKQYPIGLTGIEENNLYNTTTRNIAIKNLSCKKLNFLIPKEGALCINIYSTSGRAIFSSSDYYQSGEHSFLFNNNKISPGIYLLEMNYNGTKTVSKSAVIK